MLIGSLATTLRILETVGFRKSTKLIPTQINETTVTETMWTCKIVLSYCIFSLSDFKFIFKNSLSLRGNSCNMILNTGVNDQLCSMYGTYDIFHSIFCKWKQNKYRYTYWAGWSPVLNRQPSPNHHNRRNRRHRTPSLCYCEHRNINRRVCLNIFFST